LASTVWSHLAVRSGGAPATRRLRPVHAYPELPEDVDVEIDDKDMRIDTFPVERRRRPARQRDGLGDPHHASADRHGRLVPERAIAASQLAIRR
jgi:hypothetical protein